MTNLLPDLTPEQEAEILNALSAKESLTKAQVIKVRPGAIERNSAEKAVKLPSGFERRVANVKLMFGIKDRRKNTRSTESCETTKTGLSREVSDNAQIPTNNKGNGFSVLCGALKKLILG